MGEKRVGKALKICRRYLNWIQNSVFEGELSEAKLKMLLIEMKKLMKLKEDSLIVFSMRDEKLVKKKIIGVERGEIDPFL